MPVYCSAYGCNNRRNAENIARGITFHKFPKEKCLRRQWELAVRREDFTATEASKLCSQHFRPPDFDRTGQIVRLREGVVPSVFNFTPLKKTVANRTSKALRRAESGPPVERQPNADHSYALPDCPALLKARLTEALARVESLERERQSARARERRAYRTVQSLLDDLKKKRLINRELKQKLDHFSDLQIDCFSRRGCEYTPQQREFALTLHLHGPKAYSYLRESLQLPLPHPHTLHRWRKWVEAEPAASSVMLDMCVSMTEACGEAPPACGEAPPACGEAPPACGEAPPACGEAPPACGEASESHGEAPAAHGEAVWSECRGEAFESRGEASAAPPGGQL
ncbi:THAP domain-containing protein 6-like [Salarias fasciatus]|uniref:THAP domain-containing protein 6-like n=1 Tax=Salarias fasciatus TaxID=181472 RepID=A0A672FHC8_SALFA|nr:THAP domain-containing protein 6-like [Salarias fasciatus]